MARRSKFTKGNVYNGKEIKMEGDMEADCGVLDAIHDSIAKAVSDGAGTMVVYDIRLPRQYAEQNNANEKFVKIQCEICRHLKRADGSECSPRYIAVRDAMSESPVFKVGMFLPEGSSYNRDEFERMGTCITHGKTMDWKPYIDKDDSAMLCERSGVQVRDSVPLDGTREASDEAFYVASEMATMIAKPKNKTRAERMLFRSRKG